MAWFSEAVEALVLCQFFFFFRGVLFFAILDNEVVNKNYLLCVSDHNYSVTFREAA